MREEKVIASIEQFLDYYNHYYVNVHGSMYSANGTPDIITHDRDNIFMGIEAKATGNQPSTNQWRKCIEILDAGGRYVVAYEDFDLIKLEQHKIPKVEIGNTVGFDEFEAAELKLTGTTEVILKK